MAARRSRPPVPRKSPIEREILKTLGTIRDLLFILIVGLVVYNWVDYSDRTVVLTGFLFVGLLYAIFKKKL